MGTSIHKRIVQMISKDQFKYVRYDAFTGYHVFRDKKTNTSSMWRANKFTNNEKKFQFRNTTMEYVTSFPQEETKGK